MFSELIVDGKIMAYTLSRANRFYFFGTGNTSATDLPVLFPNLEFCFLKQVHGREVIAARANDTPEADGHFTNVVGRALVVQSADCMPALLSGGDAVCAVHAGWRGMTLNILGAALTQMPTV